MHTFLLGVSLELLRAYKKQEDRAAGVALGALLSMKLIGIPLFLYFVLQRRMTIIFWALGSIAALYTIAIAVLGFSVVPDCVLVRSMVLLVFASGVAIKLSKAMEWEKSTTMTISRGL